MAMALITLSSILVDVQQIHIRLYIKVKDMFKQFKILDKYITGSNTVHFDKITTLRTTKTSKELNKDVTKL